MNNEFFAEGFKTQLNKRILEPEEIISEFEATLYGNRKDNRALTFSMVAYDILEKTKLDKDNKILEVCCGTGELAHNLFRLTKNKNIVASDGSKELISIAKKRYGDEAIRFDVENIHKHSGKNSFDVVICKDSMHHFKDVKKSLIELLDLVKIGGFLYIFDLSRDCLDEDVQKRLAVMENEHERMRFLRSLNAALTLDEMKKMMVELNITNILYFSTKDFSKKNINIHKSLIMNDKIKEHELFSLFKIYIIKKLSG